MASKKRTLLTLNEKVDAIKLLDQGIPAYKVAERYGVGKTQIQTLRKRKCEVLSDFESNVPGNVKRRRHTTGNEELNSLTFEWFKNALHRRIPVTGPLIQSQALEFASKLGKSEFKASKGWLESFLKRHDIKFGTMSGERGDVRESTVTDWKLKLPKLCENFDPKDIFNLDESGLFFRDTTRKTFHFQGQECAGGKRAKNRITVCFCSSMTGEKIKPIVIGKSRSPRCFGKVDINTLPVHYYNNKAAWMDSNIYETFLKWFNRKMRAQNRTVLLFVDNAPSHPHLTFSNIKIHFFPPNTTCLTQPMDQGIIQAAKLKFRRKQLQYMVREMERKPTLQGSDLLKQISILDAIYWISSSWNEIETETITKCFGKAGFNTQISQLDPSFTEENSSVNYEFDTDDDIPLSILKASHEVFGCTFKDLPLVDKDSSTCNTDTINWEQPVENLLEILKPESCVLSDSDNDNDQCDGNDCDSFSAPTFTEACGLVKKLKRFATSVGNSKMVQLLVDIDDELSASAVNRKKQTKIHDFFQPRDT